MQRMRMRHSRKKCWTALDLASEILLLLGLTFNSNDRPAMPTQKVTILLAVAGVLLLPGRATAAALVVPALSGKTEYEGWETLTNTNYPSYPGFPGTAPWPSPIDSNIPGSAGNADFAKLSGGGFPGSESIYNFTVPGTYEVGNSSPIGGLETVTLQLDLGEGNSFFVAPPTLNYNGGSQGLAPTYTKSGSGPTSFTNPQTGTPGTTTLFGYQWDLSSIGGAFADYAIQWTSDAHATTFNLRLDSSDTFTGNAITAVPEPATYPLAVSLLALAAVVAKRRRRRAP